MESRVEHVDYDVDLMLKDKGPLKDDYSAIVEHANRQPKHHSATSSDDTSDPSGDQLPYDDPHSSSDPQRQIRTSFELPMSWTGQGLKVEKSAVCSANFVIPPSAADGRWSMKVSGNSIVYGPMGSSYGSCLLEYGLVPQKTYLSSCVFLDNHLGGSVGIAQRIQRHSMIRLECEAPSNNNTKWPCAFLSLSTVKAFKDDSMWTKFGLRLGTNSMLPTAVQLDVGQRGKTLLRIATSQFQHFFAEVRTWFPSGRYLQTSVGNRIGIDGLCFDILLWQGALGIGLRSSLTRIHWLFSFQSGLLNVTFPIALPLYLDSMESYFGSLYLGFISFVIQDTIAMVVPGKSASLDDEHQKKLQREQALHFKRKQREEAMAHQKLMERKAKDTVRKEQEINGLVVLQATYAAPGEEPLDVTTQLQFWTQNSSLSLPAGSKKNLLGFHDLSSDETHDDMDHHNFTLNIVTLLWKVLFPTEGSQLLGGTPSSRDYKASREPTLAVRYRFGNIEDQVTIKDMDPLTLPSRAS